MTAESLILTPNAIVVASDGNITISGKKSFSGVDKIKKLSEKPPMVLMYYGNADFASLELESSVEEFIENLDFNKVCNVKNISKEFLKFLEKNSYPDDVEHFVDFHLERFKRDIQKELKGMNKTQFLNFLNSLEKVDIFGFVLDLNISFEDIIPDFIMNTNEVNNDLLKVFSNDLTKRGSGIVITGFDKEFNRPSYIHFNLLVNNNGKIEYKCQDFVENYDGAAIISFAQDDEINTYIYGIHPEFEISIINYLQDQLRVCFNDFYNVLVESGEFNDTVLNQIRVYKELFENDFLQYELNFINKLDEWEIENYHSILSIIPLLPKSYLVTFARFLILLVSSKKKYSLDLESVGGDIKACLITKVNLELITFDDGNF